ncbi:uncharacterized protein BDZ99DRAFT_479938 [Mytilinidion resinicola]|uniref:Uncharacterized protein n=1 Tax=Mytilinidion resinicola TaxID=574789 RepID=A0A6A6YDJ2_9PEZI|nr:uncharacterized protein BDZ99DRAFT_479938 [Mytilinidion resinicola]KAF2805917.1 hypothetical protein BDZ99DRAFT_479938 [Mytilinidion resinicola]
MSSSPSFDAFCAYESCSQQGIILCNCNNAPEYDTQRPPASIPAWCYDHCGTAMLHVLQSPHYAECMVRRDRKLISAIGTAIKRWYLTYAESLINLLVHNVTTTCGTINVSCTRKALGEVCALPSNLEEWEKEAVLAFDQSDLSLALTREILRLFEGDVSPIKDVKVLSAESPETPLKTVLHLPNNTTFRNDNMGHVMWVIQTKADEKWVLELTGAQYGIRGVTFPRNYFLWKVCITEHFAERPAEKEWECLVEAASDGDKLRAFHRDAGRHFFEIVKAYLKEHPEFVYLENGAFEHSLLDSTARVRHGMAQFVANRYGTNA